MNITRLFIQERDDSDVFINDVSGGGGPVPKSSDKDSSKSAGKSDGGNVGDEVDDGDNNPPIIGGNDDVDDDKEGSCEYELIGVTVHKGTADGGHYYSFIRDRGAVAESSAVGAASSG